MPKQNRIKKKNNEIKRDKSLGSTPISLLNQAHEYIEKQCLLFDAFYNQRRNNFIKILRLKSNYKNFSSI